MHSKIHFIATPFSELSLETWYDISKLRVEVFIVEQQCIYQEFDGKDLQAIHLYGYHDGKLAASARLLPPGVSYDGYCSIGRVVSEAAFRRYGFGMQLMEEAVRLCGVYYPGIPIKISAQEYLLKFYERFGFEAVGDIYMEDGIRHSAMIRRAD
jgi:ElaA protein